MRVWVRWSAWLCLSLMLWTVAAESTHHHPNQTDSASCLICVAAHSASPAALSGHATPVFAAVGLLQEELVLANTRVDFSDAGIRGPPAVV
jgi:hypothetical protein